MKTMRMIKAERLILSILGEYINIVDECEYLIICAIKGEIKPAIAKRKCLPMAERLYVLSRRAQSIGERYSINSVMPYYSNVIEFPISYMNVLRFFN